MLIYLTSQNKPSFSSHTCTAMSHESLETFDNNDYEIWCEKNGLLVASGIRSELEGPPVIQCPLSELSLELSSFSF